MTVKQIKDILGPLGILHGVNSFPGEPTSMSHCVSVKKGTAHLAMDTLRQHGAITYHAYAFGPYSESINVHRKERG